MKAARLAMVVLLLASTPAAAGQLNASKDPVVAGPLTGGQPDCSKLTEGTEDEVVAVVKLCARIYALDPAIDGDDTRDFGILWLQTNVDSRNGWCATRVTTRALVGTGGEVHEITPARALTTKKKQKKVKLKLVADAQGKASEAASVAQSFLLRKRKYRKIVKDTEDGTLVRGKWTGSSGSPLAFVLGLEISWDATSGSPTMKPRLSYRFRKSGCGR